MARRFLVVCTLMISGLHAAAACSGDDGARDADAPAAGSEGGPSTAPSIAEAAAPATDTSAPPQDPRDAMAPVAPDAVAPAAQCASPTLGRGLAWTRSEPMFVSGLSVGLPPPVPAAVNDYFDAFHATAVHLWANGLPTRIGAYQAANHPKFRFVSWVDASGMSVDNGVLLGGVGANSPGRIGFQIGDEPADEAALDVMLASAVKVRAVDPNALVILNFMDDKNLDTLLAKAAAHADVDVLSIDRYAYENEQYAPMAKVRAQALQAGKPYWRYADSFAYASGDESPTEADMRWDAMVGLVYGFSGLTWFIYQIDPSHDLRPELFTENGSFAAPKTERYAVAAAINREVSHLGRTLNQLTSTDVRYVAGTILTQPKGTTPFAAKAGGHPYLTAVKTANATQDVHVGVFADDCGERYVMLLNPQHAHGRFPVSNEMPVTITLEFDFSQSTDASLDETKVLALDHTTGGIGALSLTPQAGKKATLSVTLGPAQPLIFKHANARPFVQK